MERNAETRERGSREAGEGNGLKKGQIEESLEPKVQNYKSLIQELYKKKDVLLATQNCFFFFNNNNNNDNNNIHYNNNKICFTENSNKSNNR